MKCIIVDDEPIARRGLKRLVEQNPDVEVCALCASAEEAAEFMVGKAVDLLFLDIQMPGISGIEFARQLPQKAMVIFTTAYTEYAIDSYEVSAIDYLVKPIDPERLSQAIAKARNYHNLLAGAELSEESPVINSEHIIVKADRRFVRVRIADIRFIEGLKDYAIIHTADRRVVTRITIKGIADMLPHEKFVRVNKSYIANIDFIDSFDNNDIFIGDTEISIGQNFKTELLSRLMK